MSLLENLQAKLGLEYLSDLTFLEDLSELKMIVKSIPADRYSLAEWADAVEYITKTNAHFETVTEAKKYLMNY